MWQGLLDAGVYLAPSQFEAAFVSTLHDAHTLAATDAAFTLAFQREAER